MQVLPMLSAKPHQAKACAEALLPLPVVGEAPGKEVCQPHAVSNSPTAEAKHRDTHTNTCCHDLVNAHSSKHITICRPNHSFLAHTSREQHQNSLPLSIPCRNMVQSRLISDRIFKSRSLEPFQAQAPLSRLRCAGMPCMPCCPLTCRTQ